MWCSIIIFRSLQSGSFFLIRYGMLLPSLLRFTSVFGGFFVFHVHFGCFLFSFHVVSYRNVSYRLIFLSIFSCSRSRFQFSPHIWKVLDWMSFVLPKSCFPNRLRYFPTIWTSKPPICVNTNFSCDSHKYSKSVEFFNDRKPAKMSFVIASLRLLSNSPSFKNFFLQRNCFILFEDKCNPTDTICSLKHFGRFINY